jgi:hypothetical protein
MSLTSQLAASEQESEGERDHGLDPRPLPRPREKGRGEERERGFIDNQGRERPQLRPKSMA